MCLLRLCVLRIDHKVIINSGGRIYKSWVFQPILIEKDIYLPFQAEVVFVLTSSDILLTHIGSRTVHIFATRTYRPPSQIQRQRGSLHSNFNVCCWGCIQHFQRLLINNTLSEFLFLSEANPDKFNSRFKNFVFYGKVRKKGCICDKLEERKLCGREGTFCVNFFQLLSRKRVQSPLSRSKQSCLNSLIFLRYRLAVPPSYKEKPVIFSNIHL